MSVPRVSGDQVEFFSGYTFAQRPTAFTWNDQEYRVDKVIAEWKTPDGKIFLIRTTQGEKFELVYENYENE
jgi:hypothetical protein